MQSAFMTADEIKTRITQPMISLACEIVEEAYGPTLGKALFDACNKSWSCGPMTVASVLSENVHRIYDGLDLRSYISGVLLMREEGSFIPLYIHLPTLGEKLAQDNKGFWINFSEVWEELQ